MVDGRQTQEPVPTVGVDSPVLCGGTHLRRECAMGQLSGDAAELIEEVLASTPLRFIREFLRSQKQSERRVRIGTTRAAARRNLSAAIAEGVIAVADLWQWASVSYLSL